MAKENLNILIIEDNKIDQKIIQVYIRNSEFSDSNITIQNNIEEATRTLSKVNFDIILLDLYLPDSYGLNTIKCIKEITTRIPTIVLTGLNDKKCGVKAISYGAQDYLIKGDFNTLTLEKSIKYAIERHNLVNDKIQSRNKLKQAIAQERERIAMNIHDGLGQMLIGIKYRIQNMGESGFNEPRTEFATIDSLLAKTIKEARNIHLNLYPETLICEIDEAIIELSRQFPSINFHIDVSGEIPNLEYSDKYELYRILQESFSNISKYSETLDVEIRIYRDGEKQIFEIQDFGIGFDPASHFQGMGLKNMQKRALQLNGKCIIDSKPGKGTNIKIIVPADKQKNHDKKNKTINC